MATLLLKVGCAAAVVLTSTVATRSVFAQMTPGELVNRAQMQMADDLAKRGLPVTACSFYYTVGMKGVKEAMDRYELIARALNPKQQEKCLADARQILARAP